MGIGPTSEVLKAKQDVHAGNERLAFYNPIWEEFRCHFWCQLVCYIGATAGIS